MSPCGVHPISLETDGSNFRQEGKSKRRTHTAWLVRLEVNQRGRARVYQFLPPYWFNRSSTLVNQDAGKPNHGQGMSLRLANGSNYSDHPGQGEARARVCLFGYRMAGEWRRCQWRKSQAVTSLHKSPHGRTAPRTVALCQARGERQSSPHNQASIQTEARALTAFCTSLGK